MSDKTERTKEEIIAEVLGWESFSSGPVMADTDDFLKAMEEYRQSSPVEKWVSVEKQLPKNNEKVLCLTRVFRRMIENSWMEHTDQDAEWFIRQFSHWQHLPELPPIEEPKD